MEVVICRDEAEVGRIAAAKVAQVAHRVGPQVVLGVATGSSPLSTYSALTDLVHQGSLDLSQASAFALDEYVGVPASDPHSYAATIDQTVTQPLGMDAARVHVPDGMADDIDKACQRYEQMIRDAGGVDVQILGVGANAHIGFNEPGSSLASRTRIKTLTERTRRDNARFFGSIDEVPTHCLTQGLGTIMAARDVVLVATGDSKAEAIAAVVEGPIGARRPGSVLQMHPHATIVVDEAAAVRLELADYYREVWNSKPEWQRFAH